MIVFTIILDSIQCSVYIMTTCYQWDGAYINEERAMFITATATAWCF